MHPRNLILATLILTAMAVSANDISLGTRDGLALQISPAGRIVSVQLAGRRIQAGASSGGIAVRDVSRSSGWIPVSGRATPGRDRVTLRATAAELEVSAEVKTKGDYLAVEGTIRNAAATLNERCVDLKFHLPMDCRGWQWGTDLAGEDLIEKEIQGANTTDHITIYPLAPVSDQKLGAGISLAIPPTHPTLFATGADQDGLYVVFKIGISAATRPANETPFQLIIYRHDPEWGFRSALQRYYDFFREPFFVRRVKKSGAWGWHNPPPSQLPNADLYAFHEAGGETWRIQDEGKHGYGHEGENLATNVADFERLGKFADDEKRGIYSLPYTIVGQRQVYRLPKMPMDRDEALIEFEKWTTPEPILFQSPGPSVGFRSVSQLKDIIRNSNIYDEQQKPGVLLRQYVGNTVTFPLNPNPKLFSDSDKLTIAKYTLDDYLPMLFRGSRLMDGCYVDSLGRWPSYYNYRREHFQYSTVPLTYAGKTPQPCLWNLQSHAEYLWELSKRLHAQKKILFANGVHANRVMLGFAVDALGMEGLPSYAKRETFYATRVAAGTKPYCALNGRDSTSPVAWNSSLFLGILIGSRSAAGQELERKFLPAIIAMNDAGWEPITHARADSPAIGVERWGGGEGQPVYFSLMNRSKQPAKFSVRIDANALRLGKKAAATDLIEKRAVATMEEGNMLALSLELEPEQATAVQIIR